MIFLLGSSPGLQPQRAKTWSIGADFTPVDGLKLSTTYYDLTYTGIIQLVPFINQNQFFSVFAPIAFTQAPTQAQINSVVSQAAVINGASCAPQPSCVYGIQDVRKRNLGGFKQRGIDFSLDYRTDTGFGGVDFGINGTYVLDRQNARTAGAVYVDETQFSKFRVRSSAGLDIGGFRAQAVWNYNQGYDLDFPTGLIGQTKVGSYSTVDLFLKYDFGGEGLGKDLAFTLTANNVFDKYPPSFAGGDIVRPQRGFRNGNTLGRLIQVGFSKKF
jgi:iron complex outermembrane recepter protein